MTCSNCKKDAPFTNTVNYVVKDFYPDKVQEDNRGQRMNNAETPKNYNRTGDLCPNCLKELEKKGYLEINKIKT